MYKKRRLAQPALPSRPEHVDAALQSSLYSPFYRGIADPDINSSATVFASENQLDLLKTATHVYFDATFKMVPVIYFQLFTLFVFVADTAFPVLYALMTRKTRRLTAWYFGRCKSSCLTSPRGQQWPISKKHPWLLSEKYSAMSKSVVAGSTMPRQL